MSLLVLSLSSQAVDRLVLVQVLPLMLMFEVRRVGGQQLLVGRPQLSQGFCSYFSTLQQIPPFDSSNSLMHLHDFEALHSQCYH